MSIISSINDLSFKVDLSTGLLASVQYLPSTHCDQRPANTLINMIVIHGISLPPGHFGTDAVPRFFCGQLDFLQHPYFSALSDLRVSAHLFIDRKGVVTQFVPLSKRAWHAGVSSFHGQSCCNDFSIGIELEGTDVLPYETVQYEVLSRIILRLQGSYPAITRERIVGHSDIAPGRKTDPGDAFDWMYLDCLLQA